MIAIISFVLIVVAVVVSAYFAYNRGYDEGCATITAMYHKDIAELEKKLAELRNQNKDKAEKDFTDCKECDCYTECWADGKFVGSFYSPKETESDEQC